MGTQSIVHSNCGKPLSGNGCLQACSLACTAAFCGILPCTCKGAGLRLLESASLPGSAMKVSRVRERCSRRDEYRYRLKPRVRRVFPSPASPHRKIFKVCMPGFDCVLRLGQQGRSVRVYASTTVVSNFAHFGHVDRPWHRTAYSTE